ncbi:dolichyl-P-Man:GDP-ManGlcNAc2-PP-dolichyl beta-1,4-mannosyltransferase [Novymonas esmeraldas]|uniref:Dolichyl-P-Man:GDP-ManGlcNAc2-PP-dolichyl beta-1,4-mannosyltransferase n=1 Tax=Novymonas esmeraldas TaxID=1808958 RepID=A0AAW0ERJ7_9TRYP
MFQYEDLVWLISFPLVCAIMLWFSLDLAVLVRVGGGRRRRANARRAIERLVMSSPVTVSPVVQSPAATAHAGAGGGHSGSDGEDGGWDRYHPSTSSVVAAGGGGSGGGSTGGPLRHPQRVRQVIVPAALRIATRAVVRRAVVLVGGDFARSPRMQYHAASLARSGLVDEVVLVGLHCGNQLSEDLLLSGEPQPDAFVAHDDASAAEAAELTARAVQARLDSLAPRPGCGCVVSTQYLMSPPVPPEWLQCVIPVASLHWVVCTLYRVVVLSGLYAYHTMCATATRVNEHGQLLVTDLILLQTPPAIPFVVLVKLLVCPLAFAYSVLLYYGVLVPAAWMNAGAMRDVRQQCRLQSRTAAAGPRPWVFYPAIIVDWHNFGHTILEQSQRPTTVVHLYKFLEMHLCAGDVNVTVSQAMRRALERAYPRLKRHAPRPTAAAATTTVAAAAAAAPPSSIRGEVAGGAAPAGAGAAAAAAAAVLSMEQAKAAVAAAPSPQTVTVLYDVAPAFFRPAQRSRCVREVLERVLAPPQLPRHLTTGTSPSQTAPAVGSAGNGVTGALVSDAELAEIGWGIAGPPAWVFASAAATATATATAAAAGCDSAAAAPPVRHGIMVVGSTSWTDDDDYSLLIEALQRVDHRLRHARAGGGGGGGLVDLWVLITGKGTTRARFEDAVRAAKLSSRVVVSTYYAQSYREYSLLLSAADVGLCLHFSSSGLDLPMKGVDMVGAGLPIMALHYAAICELMGGVTRVLATQPLLPPRAGTTGGKAKVAQPSLQECERGWVFRTAADLEQLLAGFVGLSTAYDAAGAGGVTARSPPPTSLSVMQRRAYEARLRASTWEENWSRVLLPVLQHVV